MPLGIPNTFIEAKLSWHVRLEIIIPVTSLNIALLAAELSNTKSIWDLGISMP